MSSDCTLDALISAKTAERRPIATCVLRLAHGPPAEKMKAEDALLTATGTGRLGTKGVFCLFEKSEVSRVASI